MFGSGHVLYIGTSRTSQLSDHTPQHGVHHQLTNERLAKAADWCGVRSGRDYNKWKETRLTPVKGVKVSSPYIEEAPVSIECRVKQIIPLGSHDMFIAEVLNVLADEEYFDPETGAFDMQRAGLLSYIHGGYYTMGEKIGTFGWTVRKKK